MSLVVLIDPVDVLVDVACSMTEEAVCLGTFYNVFLTITQRVFDVTTCY